MRVIAGRAGGVRLVSPKTGIRPTMDRVKAAIFSSLGEIVIGARVLDLFAGTGALGIEALSRGAESALFVEQHPQATAAIEKNLQATKLSGRIRSADVFRFLKNFATSGDVFRIIFADPPYEKMESGEHFTDNLLADPALPRLLEVDGIFVLEKSPGETLPETKRWSVLRQKTYGATEVLFLTAIDTRPPQTGPLFVRRSLGEGGTAIP
ncbi:MAG TPA: 16S rRNA (guanine(966)-N(2))-methyltransferase RsmD [Chthoniobacterales bacterium]|nr:16S rRNA (guanine(966)-N(2))-methyltransferase RsmD [Chthoniobacterales bacterium]